MQTIIEDLSGAGTPYTLINAGEEYPVSGTIGDITSLIDPVSGEMIQDRAIEATCAAQTILAAAGKVPAHGWKARVSGLDGKEIVLHVRRNDYDRTIGLCRLQLGLNLKDRKNV
jgi:hypothetical protein